MEKITRFALERYADGHFTFEEGPEGEWVDASDALRLAEEVRRLNLQVSGLQPLARLNASLQEEVRGQREETERLRGKLDFALEAFRAARDGEVCGSRHSYMSWSCSRVQGHDGHHRSIHDENGASVGWLQDHRPTPENGREEVAIITGNPGAVSCPSCGTGMLPVPFCPLCGQVHYTLPENGQ